MCLRGDATIAKRGRQNKTDRFGKVSLHALWSNVFTPHIQNASAVLKLSGLNLNQLVAMFDQTLERGGVR